VYTSNIAAEYFIISLSQSPLAHYSHIINLGPPQTLWLTERWYFPPEFHLQDMNLSLASCVPPKSLGVT
jgi:hypothetical protein